MMLTLEVRNDFTHEAAKYEVSKELTDEGKRHTEDA